MLTSRPKANLPPTEEEYLQVQDDLQQARALLAAVDEEIGLLLEKRQTLEESIANNQRALTSPIRRLPPELLQCIFCLTLPTENNAVMSSKESPLLVSHVCSQWRESALSAPRLWSSLHIPVVYPFPPNAQVTDAEEHYHNANLRKCAAVVAGRRQLIQLWLSRAGKTDLYISLADASSFPAFYTSRVSHERNPMFDPFDILPLLLPYSTQWAELYLAIEPDIARPLLIVPSEQVPRLRSLKLCDFDYTTLVDLPQTNLLSAPTLRSLCFRSLGSLGSNFLKLKIHWSKLTDLSLGLGRHSEGLAELLTSCVSLVSLTVVCTRTGRRRATTHSNLQHHISLPRLQTLHWGCKNRSCSNPIFNYLVLPSLETLIFRVNPISRGLDVSPTLDPLTRWGQGVKNLDICSKSFNSPESFKLTPEVENLTFGDPLSDRWSYDVQLDDTFWKELTVPTISTNHPTPSSLDAAPLLPKLTSIVCHASAFTDDTPSAIRLFIRSRRQNSDLLASIGIQRLVHLRITGFKDRDPEGWAPYPILERSTKDREEIVEELAAVPGVDIKWPDRRTSNEDVMGGLANPVPILGPIASGISHWAYPESYVVFGDEAPTCADAWGDSRLDLLRSNTQADDPCVFTLASPKPQMNDHSLLSLDNEQRIVLRTHGTPETIRGCRDRIDEIRRQIKICEDTLSLLREEERSVPDDILCEVFRQVLPRPVELLGSTSPLNLPLYLLHVCHKWRRAAEDHPALWSSLRIPSELANDLALQVLQKWTTMTKATPLQLQLFSSVDMQNPPQILGELKASTFNRLTKLSLIGMRVQDVHILPQDTFASLEDLILTFRGSLDFHCKEKGAVKAFRSAPRLRRVGIYQLFSATEVVLPWQQLSHLVVFCSSPTYLYRECLENCPNLVYVHFALEVALEVDSDDDSDYDSGGDTDILSCERRNFHWPSISSIALSMREEFYWFASPKAIQYPPFLDRINLQALKHLHLEAQLEALDFDLDCDEWADSAKREKFVGRLKSMKSLEHLSLTSVRDSPHRSILECVPQVTTLSLSQYNENGWTYRCLAIPEFGLLPNLTTLIVEVGYKCVWDYDRGSMDPNSFRNPDNDPLPAKDFLEFIHTRRTCASWARLERLVIYATYAEQVSRERPSFAGLEEYEAGGLEVEFRLVPNGRESNDNHWFERAEELQSWPELRAWF